MQTWTIFGVGNLIYDVLDAIEANGDAPSHLVLNLSVDTSRIERSHPDIRIVGIDEFEPRSDCYAFGFVDPRKGSVLDVVAGYRLDFANLIHPTSYVAPRAVLGRGNFVGAGAVLAPHVRLGDFNFVNRQASIGHDTKLRSFNHVGPAATIAGLCRIGDRNFLGASSCVIDAIEVGTDVVLGAGGLAVRDLIEPGTYVGIPATRR